jgi:N-acetylneuraminic acid mutarotase
MKIALNTSLLLLCLNLFGQTWQTSTDLPSSASGRNHPITFAIGDTGYILTGYGASGGSEMKDFYKYVASTDKWIKASDFPGSSRGFGYGVAHSGKAYAGFGRFINTVLNDWWEYDPTTGKWSQLATFPGTPRWHPAMVAVDGKVFVGLGSSTQGDLQDWWEYDIATDKWTRKANLPGSRRHHPYYFGIGSDVYAGLGHSGNLIFKDFYKYNYQNNTWSRIADLPAQGRVAGTQFGFGGRGYVLSGQGDSPFHTNLPTGEFWEYDPTTNTWDSLPPHPGEGRWAPGTFIIGNTVYFLCGRSNSREEKDMWTYRLNLAASVENNAQSNSLRIYPNPAASHLNIALNEFSENMSISLLNLSGQIVLTQQLNSNNQQLDLAELTDGMYIIEVSNIEGIIHSQKLLIRK